MGLFSLLVALLADQLRPHDFLAAGGERPREHPHPGGSAHPALEVGRWLVKVLGPALLVSGIQLLLWRFNVLLALLFNIVMLYLMLGLRRHSERFSAIHLALRMGEIDHARQLLAGWYGFGESHANVGEICRLAIEKLLVSAHRHVFGVLFWFLLLPGAGGAVGYRLACRQAARARAGGEEHCFAVRAFEWIDWVPVRLSAFVCAAVGNFEDALYCWRTQARRWPEAALGVLLASAAGAIGVRLGMNTHHGNEMIERPELGLGGDANVEQMQNTVNLLWRALLVCLFLVALLSLLG